jgi:DEAD/DEAH box helicase domain-containing protein
MSQLNALALSETVRGRLVDFALDDHFVRGPRLTTACRDLWSGPAETGGLVGDLWVEAAFPAQSVPTTLADLADQGRINRSLCDQLHRRQAVPRTRRLYDHQLAAILAAQEDRGGRRPALVITAGTGAGKTESFLLPVLHELFSEPPVSGGGVQALILYPMNALVNDQIDRLYDWLSGQQDVRLFHFTSETPENAYWAKREGIEPFDPCRLRTRQEARGLETREGQTINPPPVPRVVPDVLVTNYSMLEYMLCRPQDAVFFGRGLRAVVLDEAHLYTGTLAAEITLLLRRLLQRCGRVPDEVLHLATSATLGTGAAGELEDFASALFSKDRELVRVIRGGEMPAALPTAVPPAVEPSAVAVAERPWLRNPTICLNSQGEPELAVDAEQLRDLVADLPMLVGPEVVLQAEAEAGDKPAALLHGTLVQSQWGFFRN